MIKNSISNNINTIKYENTNDFVEDVCLIINSAQNYVQTSVNRVLVERNWLIGYRIEELKGNNRADYGKNIISKLSKELTIKYGKGFTKTNLYNYYTFYKMFKNIFHLASGKFQKLLSWTHYRILLQVTDENIAKYSILNCNEQLFATKYKLYLPTEEELRTKIENQK